MCNLSIYLKAFRSHLAKLGIYISEKKFAVLLNAVSAVRKFFLILVRHHCGGVSNGRYVQ